MIECNNGVVTGFEECDSGANCTNCKCDPGYQPMTPRAQGCQLIPKEFVPNVKPNLDCLDIKSFGLVLYFSFNNKDGFDQTIPPGKFNSLTPASLGVSLSDVYAFLAPKITRYYYRRYLNSFRLVNRLLILRGFLPLWLQMTPTRSRGFLASIISLLI